MPEGLSPVEVGKGLQEHAEHIKHAEHEAHEEQDGAKPAETAHAEAHHERENRLNRTVSIIEASLLAIVAVLAAWSGYAAAKWSTESSLRLSRASAARAEANAASLAALNDVNFDVTTFNDWFTAWVAKDVSSMAIAERRFSPNFHRAFDAWLATDPASNPNSPPDPINMPQYKQPEKLLAARLTTEAAADYTEGVDAGNNSDGYILTTVYLATILFLAGIGSHFGYRSIRWGLAVVSTGILTIAVVLLATAPKPPT